MRIAVRRLASVLAALLVAAPALAQFGHPLKGTWSGDWGPTKENRTHVVLELNWDGKAITGNINPGPKAAPITKAELNPDTWGVHLEGDGKGSRTSAPTSAFCPAPGPKAARRATSRSSAIRNVECGI
jgi:hypothetical protein